MKEKNRTGSQQAESIRRVLSGLIRDRRMEDQFELHQVFLFWEKAVGRDIAAHAKPEVIHGTVLWLVVSDGMWMHHLHLQKPLILERINARLNGVAISDLRFRTGEIPADERKPLVKKTRKKKERSLAEMPEELAREIVGLPDDAVREALVAMWRAARDDDAGKK